MKELPEWLDRLTPEEKPPILALVQTITWSREFEKRKVFKKEQIIELIRQFMADQRDADAEYYQSQLQKVLKQRLPDKEKIIAILAKYISDAKCQVFHSHDDVFLADQILALFDVEEAKREEGGRIKTAKVICLCGSTRFTREMLVKQWELTKQGYIVVSWCALPDDYFEGEDKNHIGDQEGVKEIVDEVHKRKIDLCDEVFVLNIGGYIGESTKSEIDYAEKIGRPIRYWQALKEKE